MDTLKIEISKEDYCSLRDNPAVQVDMEARYFIVGVGKDPQAALQEQVEIPQTGAGKFQPLSHIRSASSHVGIKDASDLFRLTSRQLVAFDHIKHLTSKSDGYRSDKLSEVLADRMKTTTANGSYYIKCLIDAEVLGVLR